MAERDYHVYSMGWMYRNTELNAAFGRAQLERLDDYLAYQKESTEYFTSLLESVPYLILPVTPAGCEPNGYNYTIRFDMEALGHEHDANEFRYRIIAALNAEGVDTGVWQIHSAKNGGIPVQERLWPGLPLAVS